MSEQITPAEKVVEKSANPDQTASIIDEKTEGRINVVQIDDEQPTAKKEESDADADAKLQAFEVEEGGKTETVKTTEPFTCRNWLKQTFIEDKWFWLIIVVLLLSNIGLYRYLPVGMWFGFTLSAYSAIANDSIQTLGTFIASNHGITKWWLQWLWIAAIFNATTIYSWYMYGGDVSHERLKSKGFETAPTELNYLQTGAPIILLILTRLRIPVSTTFMILTVFVTKSKTLGKTILKSVSGYGISFGLAVLIYLPFCVLIQRYCNYARGKHDKVWMPIQWITTGVLWSVWLMQDMSNIAIFLPRALHWGELVAVCVITTIGLAIQLYMGGEKIQRVVDEKSRVKDIPEATLINFLFAVVLFVFKLASKIPMSTTWCFIGLLAGRELSLAVRNAGRTKKDACFMSSKDLASVILGFLISLAVGAGGNPYVVEGIRKTFAA